jgi:hypothetical protein
MKGIRKTILTFICCIPFIACAQEKLTVDGYFKLMQTTSFGEEVDGTQWDYLFHNRTNIRYRISDNWRATIELRNRIFAGNGVTDNPAFADLVDTDPGAVDLSFVVIDNDDLVGLVQIDRMWMEYSDELWNVTLGRQRVNWGINLFWNNHDLFNTYSLVEFDYEERPGSDAVRITRMLGDENWIEAAVNVPANDSDLVAAIRYAMPLERYDIKLLAGVYQNDLVAGLGWEGNIGDAGFKGEMAYFHAIHDERNDVYSISVSADYYFPSKLFILGGYLYQSNIEATSAGDGTQALILLRPSAKALMPFEHNLLFNAGYPVTPILNGGLTATWSPDFNATFIMGSLMYSLADNWELSLFGQVFGWYEISFNNPVNAVYLRIKNSF